MNKLLALALSLVFLFLCGCSGNGENSSSAANSAKETTASPKPNGLFSSGAEEPVSSIDSVSSQTEFEEESQMETTSSEEITSSEETASEDSTINKETGIISPSTVKNPCGITSTGRKNNSGSNWEMTLVNPWNTLHLNYSVELATIDSRFSSGLQFDKRAVKHLNEMCEAAAEDGVSLWIISAFRTYDYQQGLFNAEVNEYYYYHPNASQKEAEIGASTEVARPGTSEHNLGLAIDFNSVEQSFENTAQFKWLQKHAAEYGFIMRYAADKQDYTGVIYEPWHYRYVGKENAKKIVQSGLCLEEYLAAQG